ncbi:hypothetical protein LYNGBM3L_03260 [Moorena producens 3L]|uniref:Uncharacterized protein n=1 Tax=Moorena producens 3L TaxID=489825 RepID=F4XIJ2_9CYAN|nr:hypothetical protein LYNGBM3L_03260 [Moorena producens 3L]
MRFIPRNSKVKQSGNLTANLFDFIKYFLLLQDFLYDHAGHRKQSRLFTAF